MAFLEFAHLLWEATKPTIVLRDNKLVTRFFKTTAIPTALWNANDYVLQFNFEIAHNAGLVKNTADFFSRLEFKVMEKIRIKIGEDIQATLLEMTTTSLDVADEKQFFITQTNPEIESEEQTLQLKKKQARQNTTGWVADTQPSKLTTSVKDFIKIDVNATLNSMNGVKENARIRVEQDVDLVLKNLTLKILGQSHDEVLLKTDKGYKHFKTYEDRKIPTDCLIFRKNYGETGSVTYYQFVNPKK